MESPILLDVIGKIGLTPGVSQFPSNNNEALFVKHDNKLFKISAKSDLDRQARLFHILQRPKKLTEILNLLSGFKKKDVIEILHTLYKLNLITFESKIKNNKPNGSVINSSYYLRDHIEQRNHRARFNSQIVLIGNGVLADKIMASLRDINIKLDRIKSLPIVFEPTKKMSRPIRGKNRYTSEMMSSSFSSSLTYID